VTSRNSSKEADPAELSFWDALVVVAGRCDGVVDLKIGTTAGKGISDDSDYAKQ
jgi:hypothetical protein